MGEPVAKNRSISSKVAGCLAAGGLLVSIVVANWATSRYGFVPVGFGLAATAGTFAAGFALALRDAVQDFAGKSAVLVVILLGTVLSYMTSSHAIALASGAAFLVSELIDFGVYTRIKARARIGSTRWGIAVVVSNFIGAIVDTVVFLTIAFGVSSVMPSLAGQLVGKMWGTAPYLAFGAIRRAVSR